MQEQKYLFGTPVMTLSDSVLSFGDEQGNVSQRYYLKNLEHAKWAWKNLLKTTIYSVLHKVVEVDKTTTPYTIKMPKDLLRLVNISVVDSCGKKQAIGFNPNINTVELKCPPVKCSCACGGKDTMCDALDSISMVTEDVEINDVTYKKTTWTKKLANGDVMEVSKVPFWDSTAEDGEGAVVYEEMNVLLCTLEVTETGCVKATEGNRCLINDHCGCLMPSTQKAMCCEPTAVPQMSNVFGQFNWDATARDVVKLYNVSAERVILCYQTNGDVDGEEVLVPEYAVDTLKMGIMSRQTLFSPLFTWDEKRKAKRAFEAECNELFKYLNPIDITEFRKLGSIIPLWG